MSTSLSCCLSLRLSCGVFGQLSVFFFCILHGVAFLNANVCLNAQSFFGVRIDNCCGLSDPQALSFQLFPVRSVLRADVRGRGPMGRRQVPGVHREDGLRHLERPGGDPAVPVLGVRVRARGLLPRAAPRLCLFIAPLDIPAVSIKRHTNTFTRVQWTHMPCVSARKCATQETRAGVSLRVAFG